MTGFNWVKARAKCSLAQVFEQLRLEIREDVEQRQNLRSEDHFSGTGYAHAFHFSSTARQFSAVLASANERHSVIFSLETDAIEVRDERETVLLRMTVTLNDEGRCVAKVSGQEMEFWQVRQKMLEALFFESGVPFNIPA